MSGISPIFLPVLPGVQSRGSHAAPPTVESPLTLPPPPSLDISALHHPVIFKPMPIPGSDSHEILHMPEVNKGVDLITTNAGDASSVLSIAGAGLLLSSKNATQHIG
ncbi:MAG: hypothetical protein H7123_03585, partial [Thermoleophilia bacterium]|nr:hypothetical protein [Thermoleophilia bacterium]